MTNSFRFRSVFVIFASCLGAALFLGTLSIGRLAAASTQAADSLSGPTLTYQDFDMPGTGTPYTEYAEAPAIDPQLLVGGPTGSGQFLRLGFVAPAPNHNTIAFDRTHTGSADLVVADFDFRLTLGNAGRGHGFAFALLDTTEYSITGAVVPDSLPPGVAEEPNFTDSLGIGFDIYQSNGSMDINNNHISVHFDGQLEEMFDATPAMNLAEGLWTHARVVMRPGGSSSDVSVILTPCGAPAVTLVDQFPVPGFVPYEGRVYFGARSGGERADQDLDNVQVQFLELGQSVLSFSTGCASVVETDGEIKLTITRMGDVSGVTEVGYDTVPVSAAAGSDYVAISGTVTFSAGEITKTVSIPILDDAQNEGDELFQVVLGNAGAEGVVGGPAIVRVTIVDDESAQPVGHWSDVIPLPVIPIHAQMLPTGDVMFWDRHHDDLGNMYDGDPRLWNPATGVVTATAPVTYGVFCSGHSFMADGRLLISGGHIADTVGEPKASIYDPFTDSWERLPDMNNGRWYPSNVTLANGDVLVVAGTIQAGQVNLVPQVWGVSTNAWRYLIGALQGNFPDYADVYPFTHLAPNGQVFVAGPQQMARYLDTSGIGEWTAVASSTLAYRDFGTSVMYDDGKVLIVGGNVRSGLATPSALAEVIDLNDAFPVWQTVNPMTFPRRQHNATLLPDGTVLVTGGSRFPGFDNAAGAVFTPEIWDPVTEQWTPVAAHDRYRGYHSMALLLPDGRVLVGGGGHPDSAAGPQYNFEIFSPPYLFRGPRPVITAAPLSVRHDDTFLVETADAADIEAVTWIRLGSVTHSFNQNQRINHLAFTEVANGLHVTTPADPNLAPPGHYMLFILDENGVPSVSQIIQLLPPDETEPPSAAFISSSPDTLGEITQFTNTSTGTVLTYSWNFGDGSPVNNQVNPAHLYPAIGNYTVTLTATNSAGTDVATGIVRITQRQLFIPLILTPDD